MNALEELEALFPIDFFSMEVDLPKGKKVDLPDTSSLLSEEAFAELKCSWTKEEFILEVRVHKPFEESFFPDFEKGDSLELFFNTRTLKNIGFPTRFCHHFLILPNEVNGITSREVTHFRGSESRPLCSPEDIIVTTDFRRSKYILRVQLATTALYGFDPLVFNHLGFTYRLNRYRGAPQHFAVSSSFYSIAEHPSLWASLLLINQ
jgi:hypothetical protein